MAMTWRRRRPPPDPKIAEAKRHLEEATRDLEAAKNDEGKVNDLARRMDEMRQANRFAALMKQALRGN